MDYWNIIEQQVKSNVMPFTNANDYHYGMLFDNDAKKLVF